MKLLQVHVAVNWRPNVGYDFSADLQQGGTTEGPMGTVARHRDICRLSRGGSDLDRCVAALMHGQRVPAGLTRAAMETHQGRTGKLSSGRGCFIASGLARTGPSIVNRPFRRGSAMPLCEECFELKKNHYAGGYAAGGIERFRDHGPPTVFPHANATTTTEQRKVCSSCGAVWVTITNPDRKNDLWGLIQFGNRRPSSI